MGTIPKPVVAGPAMSSTRVSLSQLLTVRYNSVEALWSMNADNESLFDVGCATRSGRKRHDTPVGAEYGALEELPVIRHDARLWDQDNVIWWKHRKEPALPLADLVNNGPGLGNRTICFAHRQDHVGKTLFVMWPSSERDGSREPSVVMRTEKQLPAMTFRGHLETKTMLLQSRWHLPEHLRRIRLTQDGLEYRRQ